MTTVRDYLVGIKANAEDIVQQSSAAIAQIDGQPPPVDPPPVDPPPVTNYPPVPPPVNPPPNNGVTWHAPARFVPADTHAKANFNYAMGLRSSFGLCYGALDVAISNLLQTIPNIGTSVEQRNIINTFQNSSPNFGAPAGLFLPTLPSLKKSPPYKLKFKWGPSGGEECSIEFAYPMDNNPIV